MTAMDDRLAPSASEPPRELRRRALPRGATRRQKVAFWARLTVDVILASGPALLIAGKTTIGLLLTIGFGVSLMFWSFRVAFTQGRASARSRRDGRT
jgi:hypothetical protein